MSPVDMRKYPENWAEIRRRVLLRAGGSPEDPRVGARCEDCGVLNYSVGYRNDAGAFVPARGNSFYDGFEYATDYTSAREVADHLNEWVVDEHKYIVIVLTIAHVNDPNPQNVDMGNLKALCQACHNRRDAKMRSSHARDTRARKRGQARLPLTEDVS